AGCELQVPLEDRWALGDRHLLEAYRFPSAVSKRCMPVGRPDVPDPPGAVPPHGDEVALAAVLGDDDREGPRSTAAASRNLQHRQPRRPDAGGEDDGGPSVLDASEP